MKLLYGRYNMYHNSIDITTFDGYMLRIDCNKAEEELRTIAWSDHVLNAMAIDNSLEYARLYLNNKILAIGCKFTTIRALYRLTSIRLRPCWANQTRAEPEKSALPICNYSQILCRFFEFTQNLRHSQTFPFFLFILSIKQ